MPTTLKNEAVIVGIGGDHGAGPVVVLRIGDGLSRGCIGVVNLDVTGRSCYCLGSGECQSEGVSVLGQGGDGVVGHGGD